MNMPETEDSVRNDKKDAGAWMKYVLSLRGSIDSTKYGLWKRGLRQAENAHASHHLEDGLKHRFMAQYQAHTSRMLALAPNIENLAGELFNAFDFAMLTRDEEGLKTAKGSLVAAFKRVKMFDGDETEQVKAIDAYQASVETFRDRLFPQQPGWRGRSGQQEQGSEVTTR